MNIPTAGLMTLSGPLSSACTGGAPAGDASDNIQQLPCWIAPVPLIYNRKRPPSRLKAGVGEAQRSTQEQLFSCYEMARDSGVLDFWDRPEEDVYTFEDGDPV